MIELTLVIVVIIGLRNHDAERIDAGPTGAAEAALSVAAAEAPGAMEAMKYYAIVICRGRLVFFLLLLLD